MNKFLKNRSITTIFLISMALITFIILISINYLWVRFEYSKFENEAANLREEYFKNERKKLKHNVETAINTIHFFKYEFRTAYPADSRVRRLTLDRLAKMQFEEQEYIFVGTWTGVSLLGPQKGKNMINITDPNGVQIVKELISLSQTGGGYLNYVMPKFPGTAAKPKISYVQGDPDWQWYVGLGKYVDEIDVKIENKRKDLKEYINKMIRRILLLSLGIFTLVFLIALFVSKNLNREYNVFSKFFNQSADKYRRVETDLLTLMEFKALAESANYMIGKREEAEKNLHNTKNLLNNIINSMPSIVIGLNDRLEITQWNSCAETKTGIYSRNALGKKLSAIIPSYEQYTSDINRAIETQKIITREKLLTQSGDERSYNDIVIYPLSAGETRGAVLRIDDTTERVQIQEMMILHEKMLTVGGLAAGMAHEINNPLGIIVQGIQTLLHRLKYDSIKDDEIFSSDRLTPEKLVNFLESRKIYYYLTGIKEAGLRASRIVQNMLEFSRGSQKGRISCDIHDIIDKSIDLAINDYDLKKKFDFRKIKIVKDYAARIDRVVCSATEIEQVILNLLKNSAQAMAKVPVRNAEAEIKITTYQKGNTVFLEILDNGPGMPQHIQGHIFEPFFSTKEPGEGSGLGLYVSYFIITNNHQGSIDVSSKDGEWTRFTIKLPVET